METIWRETDSGQVVFEHAVPWRRRVAIGSIPAIIAAFLLYHLVTGLQLEMSSETEAGWLSALAGFLPMLMVFLVAAVSALVVIAGHQQIVLDLPRGEIRKVHDVYFLQWSWSYPIDRVRDVRVGTKVSGTYRRRARTWVIQIHLEGRARPITVGHERVTRDADELAKRIADWLGID